MKNFILKILFFLISINLVVAQNNQRNPLDYETILSEEILNDAMFNMP
jgi:preprotein translocase subunit SecG